MENISVKSFILDDISKQEEKQEKTKKKTAVEFEVVLKDNCDIVIRRKTGRTSKLLVLLIGKGQFYIKDEKTGSIEMLTAQNLKNFCNSLGQNEFVIGRDFWLHGLYGGERFAEQLTENLSDAKFVQDIKEGRCVFGGNMSEKVRGAAALWFVNKYAERIGISKCEVLRKGQGPKKSRYYNQAYAPWSDIDFDTSIPFSFIYMLEVAFGIDNARKILTAYMDTSVSLMPTKYSYPAKIMACDNVEGVGYGHIYNISEFLESFETAKKRKFNVDSFIDYFIYQLQREGYIFSPDTFWEMLADDYDMQIELYGKIREKYPENLATHHQQMSCFDRIHKNEIDEENWEKAVVAMEPYEYVSKDFSIVSPKTPADMYDEAKQQCNCLAGYVGKVTNGQCKIYFLRKNDQPDCSWVTIELFNNGEIGQVKARNNRTPGEKAMDCVHEWADKKGLILD